MGRPLYTSILLARHATEAVQPTLPTPSYPVVEKWSRWNAFDPDSDEFFEADDAVYEAFLSDQEIAERTQAQHRENARLLTERLLREANTITSSSPTSEGSDHSVIGNDATDIHISVAARMETSDDMSDEGPHSAGDDPEMQESPLPEAQPSRRQPRRAPAITEWRLSSTGEISSTIPLISVIPAGSTERESASSLELFPRLELLSDSPRPFIPVDTPPRSISPIPNTPARVSGVFSTPPTSGQTLTTPSPAPTATPRVLTWGSQSIQFTPQWVPESPTPQDTSHFLGSLVPSPLTY